MLHVENYGEYIYIKKNKIKIQPYVSLTDVEVSVSKILQHGFTEVQKVKKDYLYLRPISGESM